MHRGRSSAIGRWANLSRNPERPLAPLALMALCLALPTAFAAAQPKTFVKTGEIPGQARFFTTDKLQHVYIVTPSNEVIKYDPSGRELFRYNNNTLGELGRIDATNPFNLLLYYPDFQLAITLDRTMNPIGELNLWNLPIGNAGAVAMARDNTLWVFDNAAYQLLRVDADGKVLARSDNLNLLLGASPEPTALLARGNLVYANDPDIGLLLFDDFGQYVRTIPLTGLSDVQVFDRNLVGQQRGDLVVLDLITLDERRLSPPATPSAPRQMEMQKDKLYVLEEDGLSVYALR